MSVLIRYQCTFLHFAVLVNYLGGVTKSDDSTPYKLIAVYIILSFLQGGGIGKVLAEFHSLI